MEKIHNFIKKVVVDQQYFDYFKRMKQLKIKHITVDHTAAKNKTQDAPLVFIHGAAGTSEIYKNYMEYFSNEGWDCYSVNLSGRKSSIDKKDLVSLTIEDYADDISVLTEELNLKNPVLIGHSMGGVVAQKSAEILGDISALVLLNSGPINGVRMQLRGGLKTFRMAMRSIKATMKKQPIVPSYKIAKETVLNNIPDDQKKEVFAYLVPESTAATNQVGRSMVKVDSNKITCPKLVVSCNQDAMVKPDMQKKISNYYNAELKTYNNYAHLPMLEPNWDILATDLHKWLSNKVRK